jgi:hypothetical protein
LQVSAQTLRTQLQRLSESQIDKQLPLAPKRHDLVDAISVLIRLSALFDGLLTNGGSIAFASSEFKWTRSSSPPPVE